MQHFKFTRGKKIQDITRDQCPVRSIADSCPGHSSSKGSWFPGSFGAAALTSLTNLLPTCTVADGRRTAAYHLRLLEEIRCNPVTPIEALGDNFDMS